jgi:hypothetical protein
VLVDSEPRYGAQLFSLGDGECAPGMADDEYETTFIRMHGHGADGQDDPVLSRAAFMLHGFAVTNSVTDGDPGFVSDDYLNAISAETSIVAAELCTAGVWERVEGGYKVLDREMLIMALDAHDQDLADGCAAMGGHILYAEHPGYCDNCAAPLNRRTAGRRPR